MLTNFAFTSNQLMLGIVALALILFGMVFLFKLYYKKQADTDLSKKHANDKRKTFTKRNKYPEVDVFALSPTFFRLGLIAALLLTLGAFNWTQYAEVFEQQELVFSIDEDIEIDAPRTAEPPPPPPPPPPPVIQEVPEELVLEEDEIEFVDQSVDAETAIEMPAHVEVAAAAPPPPPPPPPPIEENMKEIFVVVEDMPMFPGCENEPDKKAKKACADKALMQYLADNVRYPSNAIDNGIQGSVIAQFVVETNGKITDVNILRDIGGGCGDEARRLIESMNKAHKWHPGKQRGKPVRVMFTLPVRFKLQYN